jgi:DnaJ-class molecular chaperone
MLQLKLDLNEPNEVCPVCKGAGWNWNKFMLDDPTKYLCQRCGGLGYIIDSFDNDFDFEEDF